MGSKFLPSVDRRVSRRGLSAFGFKLRLGHNPQRRQRLMHGCPYQAVDYILIIVPVDIA
jgi:hypothetical protein